MEELSKSKSPMEPDIKTLPKLEILSIKAICRGCVNSALQLFILESSFILPHK